MNNAPMGPCLVLEAASVAAVPLESFLAEAAPVPNVQREKSRGLRAAVPAKLALPEGSKSTGKSAHRARQAHFLQSQAEVAAIAKLAVLLLQKP